MKEYRNRRQTLGMWGLVVGWIAVLSLLLPVQSLLAAEEASPVVMPTSEPAIEPTSVPATVIPTATDPQVQAAASSLTISPQPTQLVAGESVTWTLTVTDDHDLLGATMRFWWAATILAGPTCTGNLVSCGTNPGPGYVNANFHAPGSGNADGTLTVTVLTPGPGTYTVDTSTGDSVTFTVIAAAPTPIDTPTVVTGTTHYGFNAATYQLPVGGSFASTLTVTFTGEIAGRQVVIGSGGIGSTLYSTANTLSMTGGASCTVTQQAGYVTATLDSTGDGTCVFVTTWEDSQSGSPEPFADSLVVHEWIGHVGTRVATAGIVLVAAPTATPTNTPTATPTTTPTATPTDTPTATPTNTPTMTPTNTPTMTPTAAPTNTPTATPTDTPTNTPTATPTNTPTATPTNTPTSTPTNTPTATPTNTPTSTSINTPTNTPTATPTTSPLVTSLPNTGGPGAGTSGGGATLPMLLLLGSLSLLIGGGAMRRRRSSARLRAAPRCSAEFIEG